MDKKAKQILLHAYGRNDQGWKNGSVSESDHQYAIQHGAMFPPVQFTHDETIDKLRALCDEIQPSLVVSAFLFSLSTRALEYRSALGSYIYGRSIPAHPCNHDTYCNICGFAELEYHAYQRTWDTYSFERCIYGGVRQDYSSYAMFDLMQFKQLPEVSPTAEDILIFQKVISVAKGMANGKPRDLEKLIVGMFPSNRAEREALLQTLGICGIFDTPVHKGYLYHFTPLHYRDPPMVGRGNDWKYPISWWNASYGINQDALHDVFECCIPSL